MRAAHTTWTGGWTFVASRAAHATWVGGETTGRGDDFGKFESGTHLGMGWRRLLSRGARKTTGSAVSFSVFDSDTIICITRIRVM